MTQQVQELIDKIKSEGIQEGEKKAKDIEEEAKKQAERIINDAKQRAEQLVNEANDRIKKFDESTRMALKQSSRDTLLSLHKEIQKTLQKIINTQVKDALSVEGLSGIISDVIKGSLDDRKDASLEVCLNKKDLDKLKDSFIAKLKKQLKQPLTVKASEDIGKGLTISFDAGKSSFDFTNESLAEYLSAYLNSQVSALVKESIK